MIWVVAFQNFAQEHSKSDMPSLTLLYGLIGPFESACAAVLCTPYLCMGDFSRGGGLVVLSEAVFFYLNKNTFNFI